MEPVYSRAPGRAPPGRNRIKELNKDEMRLLGFPHHTKHSIIYMLFSVERKGL